jgi:hypothetical protein
LLLTALTPPLLPQGEARAAAEAKAQPLAPRRKLPPPARSKRKATPKKVVKEAKVSYMISNMICDITYDIKYDLPDMPCAGDWI